jgi:16S rRNA (uracil1498-N3)-methyltransferase
LAPAVVESLAAGRLAVRLTGPFKLGALSGGPTLGLSIIKGPRFDWAVEKAAELGAERLAPLLAARCAGADPGEPKRRRWARLAEEARKQCGRPGPMEVSAPMALSVFLQTPTPEPRILLRPAGGPFPDGHGGRGTIVVGPEGGLTDEETLLARSAGFVACSLGPGLLRSETAALAALARWANPAPPA